jgi:hypothetical protein
MQQRDRMKYMGYRNNKEVDEGLPWLGQAEAILPVCVRV